MSLARGLAESRDEHASAEVEVTVITQTPRKEFRDEELPFRVVREPNLWELSRLLWTADLIHVAGPALSPLLLGLLMRKPVVVEHHGFQLICPTGQLFIESSGEPCPGHFMAGNRGECWKCDPALGWFASRKLWLLTFVRRWLCKRATANIMPTQWLGTQLKLPNATTIHHGLVPIEAIREVRCEASQNPLVVFQGRLVTTKGALVLLEAARILFEQKVQFELLFIGDGPERAKLEALTKNPPLTGHVRFAGRLEQADLEAVLSHASIVVVPSLGGEVFGMVAAENMQRGVPVIASDLGSLAEVLGKSGFTFRIGNSAELAKKILELLKSPKRLKEIGFREKERAALCFPISNMIRKHRLLYEKLAKERT